MKNMILHFKTLFTVLILAQLLMVGLPIFCEAQTQGNPLLRYSCAEETTSTFVYDKIRASMSDSYCDTGTRIEIVVTGSSTLGTATVTRLDQSSDHRAQVNVVWKPGQTGYLTVDVYYNKRIYRGFPKLTCKWTGLRYMYTYKIYHGDSPPGGAITLADRPSNEIKVPNDETEVQVNLEYNPANASVNFGNGLQVKQIKYYNGRDADPVFVNDYTSIPIQYYVKGRGLHTLQIEALVQTKDANSTCTKWLVGPSFDVKLTSSCYQDDVSAVQVWPTKVSDGERPVPDEEGGFPLEMNVDYKLNVTGIADFVNNYTWSSNNGGGDVILNGDVFSVNKNIGSYTIDINSKTAGCNNPDGLKFYIGKTAQSVFQQTCTITLPKLIQDNLGIVNINDLVLKHFTSTVKSKRSIIAMPGITLEMGAELIIEDEPGVAVDELNLNYIEETSFDEYGTVLSASRSYFDDRGQPLQSQYKNLSSEVVLATAVLYDAQGRQAITTLPAPIVAGTNDDEECPIDDQTGSKIQFRYKPDFVTAAPTVNYNFTHFDIILEDDVNTPTNEFSTNELTPAPLDATTEGTLGWYYSSNNGSSANANMNEPFVATSQYPYSRTLFKHDGSGEVKGVTKPGDTFKAGSLYLATADLEEVVAGDVYLDGGAIGTASYNIAYLTIRERDLGLPRPTTPIAGEFFKSTAIDETGKKSVAYTDKSGKTIISLYFGNGTTPITKSYQFYDYAGRLLASISPNGLAQYTLDTNGYSNFDDIDKTRYFYDGKGRLISTEEKIATSDALNGISTTKYVYREDGKIRFSQNQEQANATPNRYSYTNYDVSGRPIESGEYSVGVSGIAFKSAEMTAILENENIDGGLPDASGTKSERNFTYYDEPDPNFPAGIKRTQHFVYGAVSSSRKEDIITTYYSYDELGRVEWMVQDIAGLGIKTLDYRYGPTGQVQEVVYQKDATYPEGTSDGIKEYFTHFYEYDINGRLNKVYTTRELLTYDKDGFLSNPSITYPEERKSTSRIIDPGVLEHQATYSYYLHGPLKRVEFGYYKDDKGVTKALQGTDFTYTIDGKLKSINHANIDDDPGGDGLSNPNVGRDVFGMTLEYYANDYASAKNGAESITIPADYENQYSGLIKAARWHGPTEADKQFAYAYQYDQRNQFTKGDWGNVVGTTFAPNVLKPYHEAIGGYDANGNITSLQRNANVLAPADYFNYNLKYNYKANSNMLMSIEQNQSTSSTFRTYNYNDLGQTIKETEGDKSKFITYDVTGKVTGVYADALYTKPIVTFVYDGGGFRLNKTSYDTKNEYAAALRTWYVRDASGSVVCTHEEDLDLGTAPYPVEMPVYGSGRIGLYKPQTGYTLYELTDHLGNVRAVIGGSFSKEYVATMEPERDNVETYDPITGEGFFNRNPVMSETYNHTPNHIVIHKEAFDFDDAHKVIRINNLPNGEPPDVQEPIGAGIMLLVHPGDVIEADVFAKYADFSSINSDIVSNLAPFLTTTFGAAAVVDGVSIFDVSNIGDISALPVKTGTLNTNQPRAFLNYIVFDKNYKVQEYDFVQVSEDAEIPEVDPHLKLHEHLILDDIKIQKEGYIYVYVSNQSDQNMEVYFDDLRVNHNYSNIVAGSDFYPFGLAIKDREITRESYRHGYQGKFAEKDEETGWNHFELREYDPMIGRWMAKDPAGQYFSPYVGMGNNPVNGVDQDGGFFGDYFNEYGERVGNDGIIDDKAYSTTNAAIAGNTVNGVTNWSGVRASSETEFRGFITELSRDERSLAFDALLSEMENYFAAQGAIYNTPGVSRSVQANQRFSDLIGTGAPYDLKNRKGTKWDEIAYPGYAIWNGRLMRADDWGNFGFGVAAKAYGFSLGWSRFGAGLAQFKSSVRVKFGIVPGRMVPTLIPYTIRPMGGIGTWFDGPRDYNLIGAGYNY